MTNFINYYKDKNTVYDVFHKILLASAVLTPLTMIGLTLMSALVSYLAILPVAGIILFYVVALGSIVKMINDGELKNIGPMAISFFAGPLYLSALMIFNPQFIGIWGIITMAIIPLIGVISSIVAGLRYRQEYAEMSYTV